MSPPADPRLPEPSQNGWLPRLGETFYQGSASVFWTFIVNGRKTGWLDAGFHARFREILLHACHRHHLVCPIYVLMPDHLHLLLLGIASAADQKKAVPFIRTHLKPTPYDWQNQAHDHVLREAEKERGAFQSTAHYVSENPVRKGLVEAVGDWEYHGCVVPGYPKLHPSEVGYWEKFWRIYWQVTHP
jgi:putative transposase